MVSETLLWNVFFERGRRDSARNLPDVRENRDNLLEFATPQAVPVTETGDNTLWPSGPDRDPLGLNEPVLNGLPS